MLSRNVPYIVAYTTLEHLDGFFSKRKFLELYTDSVFSVGIRSVFLGNYHTDTEGKLGRYFRYTYIQKVRNLQ